tara:strand:+ start:213 stop:1835 length:1623 start_codon:yes stop_codon:yes gene_type:complete
MAFVVNDRVKETTATTGTGTVNLEGAEVGFETFVAGIGNTNTTYYCIQAQGGSAFEIGVGTVTDATPDTLSRTSVISSSNADSLVDFGAGTKDVFCTLPASKAVIEDNSTNADIAGNLTVGGTVDGVDIAARDLILTSTKTTADAALPKSGGAMTGAITTNSTFDGVDVGARDAVLTSTTTTANAALPKAGGTMTGNISHASDFTLDMGGEIILDADGGNVKFRDGGSGVGRLANDSTNLVVQVDNQDSDILFKGDDGGSAITALTLDMSAGGALVCNSDIAVPDNGKIELGAGDDLQLFHDTTNSQIINNTGSLKLRSDAYHIRSKDDATNSIVATPAGAVELYHNGSKKVDTTASGIDVNGSVTATSFSGSLSGNISQFTNNSGYVTSSGVTSVATGNGLSGGTITSTGTLTMSGSFSGNFSASGNITAFSSDSRLKNFKGKIENALDKVDKLNGYYYEWNDVAKGIDAEAFQDGIAVGVNAQEVEEIMPEVVTQAPIVDIHNLDTDYKTVYYDKLVPLLIEAIKELKTEIETLKKDK